MKKILYTTALIIFLTASFTQVIKAQDNWIQGKTGIYSAGIGGTNVIMIGSNGPLASPYISSLANTGLSLNISGEYKAWNWIGVGFESGIDFVWARYGFGGLGILAARETHYGAIGFPVIGGKANAHLMDAFGLAIANKLDVYAGINLGAMPMFFTSRGGGVDGAIFVGPQVGARYWVASNIGIFTEFGWGATFANVGATF